MSAHAALGHEFLLWEETLNHIRRRGDKAKQSQARIREQTRYRGRVTREMAAAPLTCLLHKFSPGASMQPSPTWVGEKKVQTQGSSCHCGMACLFPGTNCSQRWDSTAGLHTYLWTVTRPELHCPLDAEKRLLRPSLLFVRHGSATSMIAQTSSCPPSPPQTPTL